MLEKYIKLSYSQSSKILAKNRKILADYNLFKSYIQNLKSKNITIENLAIEKAQILRDNITMLHYHAQYYPEFFKHIPDPPLILYSLGNLKLLNKLKVAIVGSRTPNLNNIYLATELAKFLANHDIVVVSGFAKGIDTEVHKSAINNTIAILGTGLNKIYPKENIQLFDKLKTAGLVISEYPLNTLPLKYNFPKRNRLIAALADIVIIIEAKERSGSLITARFALDYNKDIFAVPGHPLDYKARGSNLLIRDGAHMLLDFSDILEILYRKYPQLSVPDIPTENMVTNEMVSQSNQVDNDILNLLSDIALEPEEILMRLNINCVDLNRILSKLELQDLIYKNPDGKICRKYNN